MSGMPDPTDTPPSAEPPSSAGGEPKASRRRLLQGALASAPVLMTLVSRPVLAETCKTPSGYVLNLPPTPPINDVARLIVAALLNAAAGTTPVLTTQVVKHMWEEYFTTGFGTFSPSSGAHWNHDELIDYLLTTMS